MKAIAISKNLENEFLRAAKIVGLTVELQKLTAMPGLVVYCITDAGVSTAPAIYFGRLLRPAHDA